jgi:FSR family fosmidomycin resistance protein-like MFS transporter
LKSEHFSVTASVEENPSESARADSTVFLILLAISFSHMLNDMIQSLVTSIYPILKANFHLDFGQIGLISLVFQVTASLLQPLVGLFTDRKPLPHSLTIGMGFSLAGLLLLSVAPTYGVLLVAAACVGFGSSIFHPESSRIARMASGGRHGLAQSIFQVGGNTGQAVGPLAAALLVVPNGQGSIAWFSIIALIAMVVLWNVGGWFGRNRDRAPKRTARASVGGMVLSNRKVAASLAILVALLFSKFFYLAAFANYYTFYLIDRFGVSVQGAQIYLFIFLSASAVGTFFGGPLGDRFGRKAVIWVSILGILPFSLVLPYMGLVATVVLSVFIGLIISSAFSAILVYAQELMPGKIGLVSGLFFGLAFGLGGVGAAALGKLADWTSIEYIFWIVSFLPAIGLLTAFLPNIEANRRKRKLATA